MKYPQRCRVCRRLLPPGALLDRCESVLECAFAQDKWTWNPCPSGRCEFTEVEHRRKEPEVGRPTVTCPDGWTTQALAP